MPENAGTIYSDIRIQLDKLRGDIKGVETQFNKLGTTNTSNANKIESSWKKSFSGINLAGVAAALGISRAFKSLIGTFAQTEQSLANVRAVTGASAQEFKALEDAARIAGETTRFTAGQAADALYYLASAGFDAQQSIDALDGVLTLAGATGSDLAQTSETLASTISAFNLEAGDATRVSNVFAAAIGNSQATMDKLAVSMRYVAPVASSFNQTLEGTTGLLQILYNNGFEASQAGTALRSALADLANAASPANARLQELGVSFDEINPQTNSYAEIIGVLNEKVTDASDIMQIFGDRAGPALIKLIEAGREEVENYTNTITGTNAAAKQYEIQNDTLAGSIDKFKSIAESAGNSLGKSLAPAIRNILDGLGKLIQLFGKAPKSLLSLLGGAGAATAGVLGLNSALGLMGITLGAALGPITGVAAGIAGIVALVSKLDKDARDRSFNKKYEDLATTMKDIKGNTSDSIDFLLEFSEQTGISLNNTIEIADEQGLITDQIREQVNLLKEKNIDNSENIGNLREELKLQEDIKNQLAVAANFMTKEEAAGLGILKLIYSTADAYEVSGDYVLQIAKNLDIQNQAFKDGIELLDIQLNSKKEFISQLEIEDAILKSNEEIANRRAEQEEARQERERNRQEEIKNQIEARKSAEQELAKETARIQTEFSIGLIDAEEKTQKLISANETLVSSLLDVGYNGLRGELGDQAIQKAIALIKELTEENINATESEKEFEKAAEELRQKAEEYAKEEEQRVKKRIQFDQDYANKFYALTADKLTLLNMEKEEQIKIAEELGANVFEVEQYYAERRKELEKETAKAIIQERIKTAEEIKAHLNNFIDLFNQIYQQDKQNAIDAETEKTDSQISEIDRKISMGIITEEEGNKQKEKIKEKNDKKIAQLEYDAQLSNWKAKGWQLLAENIIAEAKAWASAPWPLNVPAIAATTGAAILQGVLYKKSEPKPPALATGAITLPRPGGVPAVLAENGFPELSLNSGPEGQALLNMFAKSIADQLNGKQGVTINQYNTMNTDSVANLERAARLFTPYTQRELKRSGVQ